FWTPRTLHIAPDDCLLRLEVNEEVIPLGDLGFAPSTLCDYQSGFSIDLSRFLHSGKNRILMEVRNLGGPAGLNVLFGYNDRIGKIGVTAVLILLVSGF